jgi:hypothetical protein
MQPQQEQNYWKPSVENPLSEDNITAPQTPEAVGPVSAVENATASITWQASEYVHHEKSAQWFLGLIGVAVLLLMIDIFLLHEWTFGVLIVVMTLAAVVIARRPPRLITYALMPQGIKIDEKLFHFREFRAFGVVAEGAFYSIRLVPNKRFMPMVSVYFPPENGEEIVDLFGSQLPMETIKLDPIDKFVERIRF